MSDHAEPAPPGSSLPHPAIALVLMLYVAQATWTHAGIDMYDSYLPWFKHIRQMGPVAAFSAPFGSYSPPYLYLLAAVSPLADHVMSFTAVKLVSYVGHLLLLLSFRRLLLVCGHLKPGRAAALLAIVPSLLISPAVMIQCDAWWVAALVMALAAAMERRAAATFVWCGLAVGFKLQAVLAAPVFLAIALAYRWPLRTWLLAPTALAATLLPAWLTGWPATDLLTIYLRQAQFTDQIAMNAPNVWMMVQALPITLPPGLPTVANALAAGAALLFVAAATPRLRSAEPEALLRIACLGVLILPGLLPHMHERYFILADVFTLALAFQRPTWWRVAALVQLGSAGGIAAYLWGVPALAVAGGVATMVATALLALPLLRDVLHHRHADPAMGSGTEAAA